MPHFASLLVTPVEMLHPGFGDMQAGTMELAVSKGAEYLLSAADTVFHISEALTSTVLSPSVGSAFGGTPVSVSGFGFVSDARVVNGVTVTVGAHSFETFNTSFNDNACQDNCNSSCAGKCAASANATQNVSGSEAYRRCMYECFLRLTPLQSSYSATFGGVAAVRCEQRNETLVVCISPEWLFAAADPVEFLLLTGGHLVQRMTNPPRTGMPGWSNADENPDGASDAGILAFQYQQQVAASGISPTVASALAGAQLSVSGRGFRADAPYHCKWATLLYSHVLRLPARVVNSTLITCTVGYWPYHAGLSNFSLMQTDGSPVGGRSLLYFKHLAAVNASDPTLKGGGVAHQVTIFGAGFDPWRGAYLCSVHTGDNSRFTSAVARAQEYFKLVCSLPSWIRGAARTSIQLVDVLSNTSIPEPVDFSYTQQILEIVPSEVLAVDNTTRLTIKGGGFSPYSAYSVLIRRRLASPQDQGAGHVESVSCPLAEFQSQLLMVFSSKTSVLALALALSRFHSPSRVFVCVCVCVRARVGACSVTSAQERKYMSTTFNRAYEDCGRTKMV